MKQRTVLFDVDGVLADFCYGFTTEAGLTPWSHTEQQTWEFPEDKFSLALQQATWERVRSKPWWWERLDCLDERDMHVLSEFNNSNPFIQIVFATHREGTPNAQVQTNAWLSRYLVNQSNVVLTKRKGDIAKAIDADYAIDDKAENAACIHWIADVRPCKSYILDRPYNRVPLPRRVRRVFSVAEFLDDVKNKR